MDCSWKMYLPEYRLPHFLVYCFGCFGLFIVAIALLIFLVLPGIFTYLDSLDRSPVFDVPLGSTVTVGAFSISVLAIERDNRCPTETICPASASVFVVFRTSLEEREYRLEYFEDSDFSDPITLSAGHLIRIVSVSPDFPSRTQDYLVRFQVFEPPSE
ncbi:MAG: hypothetical protein Q9P01_09250 [Anaerolineae bacterium]|nr:hypothetical protein [Anaerolineae bacterium]MDQ7035002.1 hypothetical protein [Anaerolineae bacterium]